MEYVIYQLRQNCVPEDVRHNIYIYLHKVSTIAPFQTVCLSISAWTWNNFWKLPLKEAVTAWGYHLLVGGMFKTWSSNKVWQSAGVWLQIIEPPKTEWSYSVILFFSIIFWQLNMTNISQDLFCLLQQTAKKMSNFDPLSFCCPFWLRDETTISAARSHPQAQRVGLDLQIKIASRHICGTR